MLRSDIWLLIGTFVFGMGTGAYLYFVMYAPAFSFSWGTSSLQDERASSFVLVGEAYGACETSQSGCMSFRLTDNREYTRIVTDSALDIVDRREGLVARPLLEQFVEEINRLHQRGEIDAFSQTPPQCRSEPAGVVYNVRVPAREVSFFIDRCAFFEDDPLLDIVEAIARNIGLDV